MLTLPVVAYLVFSVFISAVVFILCSNIGHETDKKYVITWVSKIIGYKGQGNPISLSVDNVKAWVKRLNEKHPELTHRAKQVTRI